MTPLLVILRFDHGNLKPTWDPGAHADIDADGVRERWEQEAVQVQGYGSAAWRSLIRQHGAAPIPAGVDVATVGHLRSAWQGSGLAVVRYGLGPVPANVRRANGSWPPGYGVAHTAINAWASTWNRQTGGASVVLCLHANAGGPTARHGIVGRDQRSALAARYQEPMAAALQGLPEVSSVTRLAHYDDRQESARPWLYRGLSVLSGAYKGPDTHAALLLEPGFLDSPHHRSLWTEEGHDRLGSAIARGCAAIQAGLSQAAA